MSLINDMLQDLDRRGAREADGQATGEGRVALASSKLSGAPPLWWPGVVLALVAMVVALVWVVWLWSTGPAQTETARTEVDLEVDRIDELPASQHPSEDTAAFSFEKAITPESTFAQAQLPQPALSSAERERDVKSDPLEQRANELIESALEARRRDRLTRPVGDNAYDYYQQALALIPDHPQAHAGLTAITRRYRELLEAAIDEGDLDAARTHLRRARSVDPELPGMGASVERLQALANTSQAEPSGQAAPSKDAPQEAEPAHLRVTPDFASRDRRRAQVARQLWENGDPSGARAELEQTLADFEFSEVGPVESTTLLIELYLEADEPRSASALLESAAYLPPLKRTRMEAQVALYQGDTQRALSYLEVDLEEAQEDESYRALLARLYFSDNQPDQAAEAYRALLTDFGDEPAYWLGLGLAEDARNQAPEALRAFRRALGSGAYARNGAIRRYLERRVDALGHQLNKQDS